ncbi:hypothetical protein QBC36DRAFT_307292 [Triangularia setosa]|uniref:Uncharacterized protein n=1 Tax=Triangularia setosa TaxID=2587417 RepID=A0AAN7ABZ4_9PEZI|nr:hypothetical protein QBC36DRAFT_307292 [Podospora setosa]
MSSLLLNPRGRGSSAISAAGGSVELAAMIGIPLAIVFFIAIVLVIFSSRAGSKEKEQEVRETSCDKLYDRLVKEQSELRRTQERSPGRDGDLDYEHEGVQMETKRKQEAESKGLLTAPQPSRSRSDSCRWSDERDWDSRY